MLGYDERADVLDLSIDDYFFHVEQAPDDES